MQITFHAFLPGKDHITEDQETTLCGKKISGSIENPWKVVNETTIDTNDDRLCKRCGKMYQKKLN